MYVQSMYSTSTPTLYSVLSPYVQQTFGWIFTIVRKIFFVNKVLDGGHKLVCMNFMIQHMISSYILLVQFA